MAKLYRIRDWSALYENSRSRKVEDLRWVPIPNHHDGETFSLIMAHPEGAVIFASWVLLVQIASKCNPRGTLVRGNGVPHSAISLSAKCRAPATWFEIALNYLETNTDWLVVEEVTTERHSPTTQLAPEYQSSAEEGKEGNGKNGREGKGNGGSFQVIQSMKLELSKLFTRDPNEAWNHSDERQIFEVCKRKDPMGELAVISDYKSKLPAKEQKFFPGGAGRLLENWTEVLDRARSFKPPSCF